MCQFSSNADFFTFSVQICLKIDFRTGTSKLYVRIPNQHFQDTMHTNFQSKQTTFRSKSRKLPNYMQYFGSNNVESVAERWLEVEMS